MLHDVRGAVMPRLRYLFARPDRLTSNAISADMREILSADAYAGLNRSMQQVIV